MINKTRVENFTIELRPRHDAEIENLLLDAKRLATELEICVDFRFNTTRFYIDAETNIEAEIARYNQEAKNREYMLELANENWKLGK